MIGNSADDFVVHDLRNADPWKVIKASAEGMGIVIQNPKPSCKKCHGRGWIGRRVESGEPICCSCIFPKDPNEREIGEIQRKPLNRAERRKQNKK